MHLLVVLGHVHPLAEDGDEGELYVVVGDSTLEVVFLHRVVSLIYFFQIIA